MVASAAGFTKAEVMRMSNIELLNILLAIASLMIGAYTLGLNNRR